MVHQKEKDCWDKAEVFGKVVGVVLIPIVIGAGGLFFNSQENQRTREATEAASRRATTAQMTQIAVGVLVGEPNAETKDLRKWATEVLKNPGEIIALNSDAADQLLATSLGKLGNLRFGDFYAYPLLPSYEPEKFIQPLPDTGFVPGNTNLMEFPQMQD